MVNFISFKIPQFSISRREKWLKLVSYNVYTQIGVFERIGALVENKKIIDLNMGYTTYLNDVEKETKPYEIATVKIPPNMLSFLDGEEKSMEAAKKTVEYVKRFLEKEETITGPKGEKIVYSLDEVKLLAPVPRPRSIRDWLTSKKHTEQAIKQAQQKLGTTLPEIRETAYEIPLYYRGDHQAVIGPEEDIVWPSYEDKLDFEFELGMYIGKKGINVSEEEAERYIAGYTIFNDVSARTMQFKAHRFILGPGKGKEFYTCNVMGPCMVTPDEIGDVYNLKMVARINGEVVVETRSSIKEDRLWTWTKLIEFASKDQYVYPGDFFGGGTVGGGCGLEIGRWIKPGDIIELEVEKIGILRNKVVKKT